MIPVEKCPSYIHNLRWKDRQLECPHCHSLNVGSWGNYHRRPGPKRYRRKDCKRTFNDLTNTMLSGSRLPIHFLVFATFLLCLSCSCRCVCRELGVHVRTAYRWCGKKGGICQAVRSLPIATHLDKLSEESN
jgi:transposase-like protein